MINIKNIAVQITDGYPLIKFEYGNPKQINETFVIIPIYDSGILTAELHFNFEHYLSVNLCVMMNDGVLDNMGIINLFYKDLYTDMLNNGNDLENYLINVSRYAC